MAAATAPLAPYVAKRPDRRHRWIGLPASHLFTPEVNDALRADLVRHVSKYGGAENMTRVPTAPQPTDAKTIVELAHVTFLYGFADENKADWQAAHDELAKLNIQPSEITLVYPPDASRAVPVNLLLDKTPNDPESKVLQLVRVLVSARIRALHHRLYDEFKPRNPELLYDHPAWHVTTYSVKPWSREALRAVTVSEIPDSWRVSPIDLSAASAGDKRKRGGDEGNVEQQPMIKVARTDEKTIAAAPLVPIRTDEEKKNWIALGVTVPDEIKALIAHQRKLLHPAFKVAMDPFATDAKADETPHISLVYGTVPEHYDRMKADVTAAAITTADFEFGGGASVVNARPKPGTEPKEMEAYIYADIRSSPALTALVESLRQYLPPPPPPPPAPAAGSSAPPPPPAHRRIPLHVTLQKLTAPLPLP